MKRICMLVLALIVLLSGCGAAPPENPDYDADLPADLPDLVTEPPPPPTAATEAPTEPPETQTEAPTESEVPETEDPAVAASQQLSGMLEEALAEQGGRWSVCVRNLDTGVEAVYHDQPMVAASLIKLYVAGAYFAAVEEERVSDSSRSLVRVMLDRSDNDACNRLIDLLGMDYINDFIQREGFLDTQLNRRMLELSGVENYSSPLDCVTLLQRVLEGSFVTEEASAEILTALKNQQRTQKLPAGVPAGVPTANKTGELADTENDAAVFWTEGGVYLVCVMATDLTDTASARGGIVRLSTMIYQFFQGESEGKEVEAHE